MCKYIEVYLLLACIIQPYFTSELLNNPILVIGTANPNNKNGNKVKDNEPSLWSRQCKGFQWNVRQDNVGYNNISEFSPQIEVNKVDVFNKLLLFEALNAVFRT